MEVFVIPVARDRYELYCESPPDADELSEPAGGRFARMRQRFAQMLQAAEQRQRQGAAPVEPQGWASRLQDRMLAWVAERIAEQRLLWNLRRETAVVLVHPQDMPFEQVLTLVRRTLQHDYERHRRWLVFDTLLMLVSAVLIILPGPNVVGFYFMFRVVGHWLSMRGARQGLDHVTFTGRPCPPLTELRDVVDLEPALREQRVHDIAGRLRLQHLTAFFERVAV